MEDYRCFSEKLVLVYNWYTSSVTACLFNKFHPAWSEVPSNFFFVDSLGVLATS